MRLYLLILVHVVALELWHWLSNEAVFLQKVADVPHYQQYQEDSLRCTTVGA
jgi:hypothetical protein